MTPKSALLIGWQGTSTIRPRTYLVMTRPWESHASKSYRHRIMSVASQQAVNYVTPFYTSYLALTNYVVFCNAFYRAAGNMTPSSALLLSSTRRFVPKATVHQPARPLPGQILPANFPLRGVVSQQRIGLKQPAQASSEQPLRKYVHERL